MKKYKKNILLALMISILFIGGTFSFAYFLMDITGTGSDLSKLSTGTLELNINDNSININNLAPIYDIDYENYAYKKEFEIINNGTLNGCSDIYLDITSISESLKSKYFKYKLVSDTDTYIGDFKKVENNRLLLGKESKIENNKTKKYKLYIWLKYDEKVNQNDLLGTSMKGTLSIESKDCESLVYDYETLALYVNNTRVDELDTNKYYNLESYTCSNNEIVEYDKVSRKISINADRQTKCSLYFNESPLNPNDYIKRKSVFIYDAEYNTPSGHDDASTTLYDWSGKSNTGTLNGPTWGSNYLSFDGVDDWVSIGEHNYNNYTIEIVCNLSIVNKTQDLIGNFETGGYGIMTLNNKILHELHVNEKYNNLYSKEEVLPNKLYSITATYDVLTAKLYVNNELNSELDIDGIITKPQNSTILIVGANPTGNAAYSQYFKGKIYSVRLYKTALTDEEIKHNFIIDNARFSIN